MNWIRTAETLTDDDRALVGGKAWRTARLQRLGCHISPWVCITTEAYNAFVDTTGLRERIALEVHRKAFEEMRWEEVWDCATRIRHLFLTTPMPTALRASIEASLHTHFGGRPVAVRSSAVDEDSRQASFAGLHASYLNIRSLAAVVHHVRLVWASLWSDAAILYRREIGLNIAESAMAVLVQQLVVGTSSGVVFTADPTNAQNGVIEAVHGLNQGLVDGDIEPDRWIIRRESNAMISHTAPMRSTQVIPDGEGVRQAALPPELSNRPPLSDRQVEVVWDQAVRVENAFALPQDIEWTLSDDRLTLLQARPISTGSDRSDDQRGWYLSLHKSFDQLTELRHIIETEHLPTMITAAREMAQQDLSALTPKQLAAEIHRRWTVNQQWSAVYWSDFIPYAHGVRLFGQFYNDRIKPEDPYEFIDLLTRTDMQSLERNRLLAEMAAMVREDPHLIASVSETLDRTSFEGLLKAFLERFGDLAAGVTGSRRFDDDLRPLLGLVGEMAKGPVGPPPPAAEAAGSNEQRRRRFLDRMPPAERHYAEALLDLARNSYQLRDDDNIHLGRIEAGFLAALDEGRRRLKTLPPSEDSRRLQAVLEQVGPTADPGSEVEVPAAGRYRFRQRQLVGQPAGPGLVRAAARVITHNEQLMGFKAGEILVCDAVDPNMTFVVPLAAGIVERRGGMLIHGAIIAREYGLPCVTGVPRATAMIQTGDTVTVDGYLGIVTIE
jgi:phosphohistidine swiveling domain-containing protein